MVQGEGFVLWTSDGSAGQRGGGITGVERLHNFSLLQRDQQLIPDSTVSPKRSNRTRGNHSSLECDCTAALGEWTGRRYVRWR